MNLSPCILKFPSNQENFAPENMIYGRKINIQVKLPRKILHQKDFKDFFLLWWRKNPKDIILNCLLRHK